MKTVALVFATLAFGSWALALEFKDVEEEYKCETFPVFPTFNKTWLQGVRYLYIPFRSKSSAYKTAEDFHTPEEFMKLKESLTELKKSCEYFSYHGSQISAYAYGRYNVYQAYRDPLRRGIRYLTTPNGTVEQPAQYRSTAYSTLTDNKSYYVIIATWADGFKTFYVASIQPTLSEEALSEVKTHLISHGFDPKNFVIQDYTNCTPPASVLSLNVMTHDDFNAL